MTARRLLAACAAALAVLACGTRAVAQPYNNVIPLAFSLTGPGQASAVWNLHGESTCSVTLNVAGTAGSLVPQATSDTQANISSGAATWSTVSGINSGSVSTAGTYTGSIAATGLTAFRVVTNASATGTAVGSIVCSFAQIPGSGGGGGGGSVTQGTVPWVVNDPVGGANFAPGQATLTTTAAASIVAARTGAAGTGRISVTIVNESTTAIALGGSGVTYGTGLILPGVVGASVTLPTTAAIYGALNASGSALVSYYEIY